MEKTLREIIVEANASNDRNDDELRMSIDVAINLSHKDVFWIRENTEPEEYPWFPEITHEQIDKWADGWYGVLSRRFLPGGAIEIVLLEIHSGPLTSKRTGRYHKEPFHDIEYVPRIDDTE